MPDFKRAAALSDLAPGTALGVKIDGTPICLVNAEGEIYAIRDNCSHRDFPLSAGEVDDHTITCEWHGSKFDLKTGRPKSLPAIKPVKTFEVKVEGDDIYVAV